MCIEISIWNELDPVTQGALLERPALQVDANIRDQVASILNQVRRDGDEAIRRFTLEFDNADLSSSPVSSNEIDVAIAGRCSKRRRASASRSFQYSTTTVMS